MSEGTPAEATRDATRDLGRDAVLVELVVADPPEAWTAAGFTVQADAVRVGATTIRLTGRANPYAKGITEWSLAGLDAGDAEDLEGLPTRFVDRPWTEPTAPAAHPNGVTGLDHVVVSTPDLERTIEALADVGLECRRIRETTSYGSPMRQAFFHLGATVLEVVSGDTGSGLPAAEAPAAWFGLAVDVEDLDETAELLGEGLGGIKVAVQDGRRIATFRHKALGLSVAVAAMDDHADRGDR